VILSLQAKLLMPNLSFEFLLSSGLIISSDRLQQTAPISSQFFRFFQAPY
jgi:hypothetical protein